MLHNARLAPLLLLFDCVTAQTGRSRFVCGCFACHQGAVDLCWGSQHSAGQGFALEVTGCSCAFPCSKPIKDPVHRPHRWTTAETQARCVNVHDENNKPFHNQQANSALKPTSSKLFDKSLLPGAVFERENLGLSLPFFLLSSSSFKSIACHIPKQKKHTTSCYTSNAATN